MYVTLFKWITAPLYVLFFGAWMKFDVFPEQVMFCACVLFHAIHSVFNAKFFIPNEIPSARAIECGSVHADTVVPNNTTGIHELRGTFWARNMGYHTSLFSFDGSQVEHDLYHIKTNSKNWSFGSSDSIAIYVAYWCRISYYFRLDTSNDTRKYTIDTCLMDTMYGMIPKCLLYLDMIPSSDETYPDSVSWTRRTYVFGFLLDSYELVQTIDGDGKHLRAHSDWVEYNQQKKKYRGHVYTFRALPINDSPP
jgi:hypothetical protein